ncbi:hypothetical protein EON66_11845, partial [archaeon]
MTWTPAKWYVLVHGLQPIACALPHVHACVPACLRAYVQAALLSCLVHTEKGDDEAPPLREELSGPYRALQDAARRIAQVSQDCKIEIDVEEYVQSFRSEMMELVFAWVNGAKFIDICAMTKQFEGSIIRVIRRLEELARQL